MLNDIELNKLMSAHKLTADGRAIVAHVRSSRPARNVQGGGGNVACRYPSRKMKRTIQAESHGNELAAVYLWDHDTETHEFYDQPPQVKINYVDRVGKRRAHVTTPDFFVIQDDFIGWVECKTENWLQLKADEQSPLFVKDPNGSWACPPAEAFAAQFGLGFKLRSSGENPHTYIRNLVFLSDYWKAPLSEQYLLQKKNVLSTFGTKNWCYLKHLLEENSAAADTIFQAIVQDELYVDLYEYSLADTEFTKVYRNRIVADASRLQCLGAGVGVSSIQNSIAQVRLERDERIDWDGRIFTVKAAGESMVFLEDEIGEIVSLKRGQVDQLVKNGSVTGLQVGMDSLQSIAETAVSEAGPLDLKNAVSRFRTLQKIQGDPDAANEIPARTLRHWKLLKRRGEMIYGDGFTGLISHISRRGNSLRKLDQRVLDTMSDVIENDYTGANAKSITVCYGILRARCNDLSIIPPSEKTFRNEIKRSYSAFDLSTSREGARAAYSMEPFIFVLEHSSPRHGDRPFEIAHIDHTELDLQLVGSKFGEQLRRPWLTVMLDAYSRSVLSMVITFDPPSYRSCMLVMRECIRRHNRVPATLVLDRGAEFDSTFFEALLARLEVTKKSRPPQKPRFGSIIERFFGISNTQLVHNLRGNNKPLQKARQMSSTHDPRERAVWTLAEFTQKFEHFVYEVYGNLDHSALGVSPNTALKVGLAQTGQRPMRLIPLSEELAMYCLPSTPKGTSRINPAKGIKIGYLYYRHPIMSEHRYTGLDVPVRYDPFDLGKAYAFIGGKWRLCESELAKLFAGRTEREIATIAGEINGKNKLTGQRRATNAEQIARFIMKLEGSEITLLQQKRDAEWRQASQHEIETDQTNSILTDAEVVPDDDPWSDLNVPSFGVFK